MERLGGDVLALDALRWLDDRQRPVRTGACGRLQAVALPPRPAGPVRVVVTTRGVQPFSGALLQR